MTEDDDGLREDRGSGLFADDGEDPERRLIQREEAAGREEEGDDKGAGLLNRTDELLKEFSLEEREMLRLVMEEDLSVTAAAEETGVRGNAHATLRKMLQVLKERVEEGETR